MTDVRATGGQRETLPALFAVTVAGAGALVLVLARQNHTDDITVPVPGISTAVATASAGPLAEAARLDSQDNYRQRLEIERALVSNNTQLRETVFNTALPELLAADPESVVELVARQDGETRNILRDEVVRLWIRQDRDAAVIWMGSFEDESERKASAIVAMRTLAAIDPAQAVLVANEFGVGRDDGSLEHIVQIWATENPDECLRWLQTQPDNPQTAQLRTRAEQVRAQMSPDKRD